MRGPQHEFCAKMKFPAQKNKNTSVNGTTSLTVIVGPKCLIAHLLAPHDRAFSPQQMYEKAHLLAMYQGNKVRLHILFVRAIGICIHILQYLYIDTYT